MIKPLWGGTGRNGGVLRPGRARAPEAVLDEALAPLELDECIPRKTED